MTQEVKRGELTFKQFKSGYKIYIWNWSNDVKEYAIENKWQKRLQDIFVFLLFFMSWGNITIFDTIKTSTTKHINNKIIYKKLNTTHQTTKPSLKNSCIAHPHRYTPHIHTHHHHTLSSTQTTTTAKTYKNQWRQWPIQIQQILEQLIKGVLHPRPILWLLVHFSEKNTTHWWQVRYVSYR